MEAPLHWVRGSYRLRYHFALQVEHSFKCKLPAIPKSGNKMFTIKFDKSDSDFPESAELAIELMETCAAQDDGAKLDLTLNLEFEYDYKVKYKHFATSTGCLNLG